MLTCMPLYDTFSLMRLSQYAIQMNISYKTAFRWWKAGRLDAYQLDTGTIIVRDLFPETPTPRRSLEVMFPSDTKHDLVDDFIAVMTSMASWIYRRRHSKERAEKIKQCVEQVMKQEAP